MKHKNFLDKTLYFLRLTDDDGILSITHIACMIVLAKVAVASQPSIADMGTLLVTLSLYFGKRYNQSRKAKLQDEAKQAIGDITDKLKSLQDKTAGISARVGFTNPIMQNDPRDRR